MVTKSNNDVSRKGTQRKVEFIPLIADAFVENGYHQTTTADLANRCEVRENELYRIWPSKKNMFLDAIRYIFNSTVREWNALTEQESTKGKSNAERLIAHQAKNQGHRRFYRIVFSGLIELTDPEVKNELRQLYRQFHRTIAEYIASHRMEKKETFGLDNVQQSAWAMMGVAAIVDMQRELGLSTKEKRTQLLESTSLAILNQL